MTTSGRPIAAMAPAIKTRIATLRSPKKPHVPGTSAVGLVFLNRKPAVSFSGSVEMRIRVTGIFRRVDGDWMIHRDVDAPS
jgi:hypothetical protein